MPAQDPDELFDLYTRGGAPLGRTKPRALVHRDGDWHRSLHVWLVLQRPIAGRADGSWLVLQRRSMAKDTWPGALDVAVAGHLGAGEGVADALREAEEEIGLTLRWADVVRLGLRRRADESRPGVRDNELQEVVAAISPVRLERLSPNPAEVDALVALPFDDAGALLRGERDEADGVQLGADRSVVATTVTRAELIPDPDGYYARAHASLAALLAGAPEPPWEIG